MSAVEQDLDEFLAGDEPEVFWSKVDKNGPLPKWAPFLGPCWLWTGATTGDGYGSLSHEYAHRIAYELLVGPIPAKYQVDHLCRVRSCVNPTHLEAVTQRENILRGQSPAAMQARQTHCKRDHEFTAENTLLISNKRRCRQCGKDAARQWRADRKAVAA